MLFRVYHQDHRFISGKSVADIEVPDDLTLSQKLDYVFEHTNHIDFSWTSQTCVIMLPGIDKTKVRSTSVGDIITNLSTGKSYLCDAVGWVSFDGSEIV